MRTFASKILNNSKFITDNGKRGNVPPSIQTKLKVGSPNDVYEKEADQVSRQIMNDSNLSFSLGAQDYSEVPPIQKQAESEEEELLQAKSDNSGNVSADTQQKIQNSKGSGKKIPNHTRNFMENRFGRDFSQVNIHNNDQAAKLSDRLHARAFTLGDDIFFNKGRFSPETIEGKELIAHELTHVVQQRKGLIQRQVAEPQTEEHEERVPFEFPGITRMMTRAETQAHILSMSISNTALAATLQALVVASTTMDITMGVGVQLEGAGVIGVVGSAGYVINDGRLGYYGSYGGDVGAVVSASAELIFTVIDGGLDKFSGGAVAAVFGGGEVLVGHLTVLFSTSNSDFLGIAVSGGVGIGLTPVEAYITISNTHAPSQ